MPDRPFIVCDNLVKIYKIAQLEVVALQGLDLIVSPGELLGIVGASGSGKSTLMNILGGLDRPSAGRVFVEGVNLLNLSDAELTKYRQKKVGFVWQQGARNLLPYLTAMENVEVPMTLAGVPFSEARKRAEILLQTVGLEDRKNHTMQQLSGGEQQRVAISVALANQPSLLLADEPTGELDSTTSLTIYQAFRDLNAQFGVTTLIVSHDATIARHVQRVVAIRDGKTASETVRKDNGVAQENISGDTRSEQGEEQFEELVVLDTAGRLQIPKEYLEKFSIHGRAKLEVGENGILIVPVETKGSEHEYLKGDLNTTTETSPKRSWPLFGKRKNQEKD
jgi:ABC-type lipoprotein export system ATPase subunit/bifunctional DNA-binding transcriptional regulator/antitoxin component of YhaV-PrlF toxin-antitoxin module